MDAKEINKRLYDQGVQLDMCERVRKEWDKTLSEQELINLWYRNYDFALVNHFPDNKDIKDCFAKDILRKNCVLVDDMWSLLNPEKAMILGRSESNVRFNAFHVGQVWVRDTSCANIYVRDNAIVTVCVMDKAVLNIVNYSPSASVVVMKYSPTARMSSTGTNVRIKDNYSYLNKT